MCWRRHCDLWGKDICIFQKLVFDEVAVDTLEHEEQLSYDHVFVDISVRTAKSQCAQIV